MSQGITIYNAAGKVQIDENYSNYAIYQKGSSLVPSRGYVTVYFNPVGGLIPMIYLRAMESGATFAIESVTSSSFVLVNHAYPSRGIVVDWFTCFPISALGPSGDAYGFRVFKPNGTVCFDSGREVPRIFHVQQLPAIADQEEGNYEQAIVPPSPTGRYPYILANMIRSSYTSYASVSKSIGFRIEPISSTVYNVYPTSFTIGHGMGLESAVYGYVTPILVFADAPN